MADKNSTPDQKFTTDRYASQDATAHYNGVEVRFRVGTSRDYDEWMSDDGAGDSYYGTMDGNNSPEAKAAMKQAEEIWKAQQKGPTQAAPAAAAPAKKAAKKKDPVFPDEPPKTPLKQQEEKASIFDPKSAAAPDQQAEVQGYREKFSGEKKEAKRSEAKERASKFALNGPGQTSTNINYDDITGSKVAERTRQMGQDMSKDFQSNWAEFLNPSGYKGHDPEGL
jgi:hypothetical protein